MVQEARPALLLTRFAKMSGSFDGMIFSRKFKAFGVRLTRPNRWFAALANAFGKPP